MASAYACHWICRLLLLLFFFFESLSWFIWMTDMNIYLNDWAEKKQENSGGCFTPGLQKILINFILTIFSLQSLTQQNQDYFEQFSYFIQVTKMSSNKSQLFKKTTCVILVCHWPVCKPNNMYTCFFVHCRHTTLPLQYIVWVVFFWKKPNRLMMKATGSEIPF